MSTFESKVTTEGELSATIIRADGSHRDTLLSRDKHVLTAGDLKKKLFATLSRTRKLYERLKSSKVLPIGMTLAGFAYWLHNHDASGLQLGLVTTAGVDLMASDFVSGASTHISAFNFHDSGTGVTAAAIGDTTLGTQAGPTTRATGVQSNPSAISYKSVGTINYVSTLAITEFGLFSQAAQGGTLWDHRVFSAINVLSGDSVTFSYVCTLTAGGT
jgi:hypothetical protein